MALDFWCCLTGAYTGNSRLRRTQRHSAGTMRQSPFGWQRKKGFQQGLLFFSIRKKAEECFRSSEPTCMSGSTQSTHPGIERESTVPESQQRRGAERQLLPRTIYEIMLTKE